MKKAAVVIGVNKTGKLTPLSSAAAGAERVAKWLEKEGFKVECITDAKGSVECSKIETAVESFVTLPPRYHLLLVYFSGHGYWQARSDVWLLSGAPVKPNEAINLEAAMDLAKYSGIPNVVFVSDACRSLPDSRSGAHVTGSGLFPNYDEITTPSKIDYFKATSEALPAYEGKLDGDAQSVLTAALLAAYEEPDEPMVRRIVEGRETIEVVPNRRLEDYLQRKVDALLAQIDPNVEQQIDINVPSSEDVYIARVRRPPSPAVPPPQMGVPLAPTSTPPSPAPPPPPAVTEGREAAVAIAASLSGDSSRRRRLGDSLSVRSPKTESKVNKRLPDVRVDHFESQMGFVIQGAAVQRAVAVRRGLSANVLAQGDGLSNAGIVRIEAPDGSVVQAQGITAVGVQLSDGRAVVLAGLPGYIGHAVFKQEGLANVSYVPSSNHWRYGEYQQRRDEIDRLRAMVALAVDRQTFRLRSEAEANALAERIRIYKGVDPTLGLYAAYAFSQASNERQVASVMSYMRDDLGADLFDVRLLASRRPGLAGNVPVVPFCPLLTQSWNLLAARRVELPAVLQEAGESLCGSLWTTFEPEAGDRILDAIHAGELQ